MWYYLQAFEAWRIYAVNSHFKKENTLSRVTEAQNDLKRGIHMDTF